MVDPQQYIAEQARRSSGAAPSYQAPAPKPKSPLAPPDALSAPTEAPAAPPASKMLTPPVIHVTLEWTDPDRNQRTHTLDVRILTFDERVEVARRAGKVARVPWEQLPQEEQELIRAICTCFVMWPNLPDELRWAVTNDPVVAFELAAVVEAHRTTYFRGDAGEGEAAPAAPRVVVHRPPATDAAGQ